MKRAYQPIEIDKIMKIKVGENGEIIRCAIYTAKSTERNKITTPNHKVK